LAETAARQSVTFLNLIERYMMESDLFLYMLIGLYGLAALTFGFGFLLEALLDN